MFDVPQADRRRRQVDPLLGEHLQLRAREAGVLLPGLLGQPPAERPPPQRLLHRGVRPPRIGTPATAPAPLRWLSRAARGRSAPSAPSRSRRRAPPPPWSAGPAPGTGR